MPELPEVEIIARLLGEATKDARVVSAKAKGVGTLRSYDPALTTLIDSRISAVARAGKHLIVSFDNKSSLLIHLMSAGRLQLFDKPATPRDRTSRLLLGLEDGRELRLREFGTRQSAWAKLMKDSDLEGEESLSTLGPEAWPDPPALGTLLSDEARPLHSLLRDQRVIAGIGRSWVDEILHHAMLGPFRRGNTLSSQELNTLRESIVKILNDAIEHYANVLTLPIPDKLPMPLRIHRQQGSPCPRCETQLEAVYYEDHIMVYCPQCQTEGRKLKDRRLSRLLK